MILSVCIVALVAVTLSMGRGCQKSSPHIVAPRRAKRKGHSLKCFLKLCSMTSVIPSCREGWEMGKHFRCVPNKERWCVWKSRERARTASKVHQFSTWCTTLRWGAKADRLAYQERNSTDLCFSGNLLSNKRIFKIIERMDCSPLVITSHNFNLWLNCL